MLDPNELILVDAHEHYIYGDDYLNFAARVDAEDYWFFSRWRWFVKFDKRGKKPYLFRVTDNGRAGGRQTTSIFLHVAIKERADPGRPPGHSMMDHADSDSLNCRRYNLGYATPSMNRRSARR
jgi:hypothetical protein